MTKGNQLPKYSFGTDFYKFPSYYRRAAIAEALGKVTSYESNLKRWHSTHTGKRPGKPTAGHVYPALYRDNTFIRVDSLTAQVKVWIHNTWDWITIPLRKTDVSYIVYSEALLRKEGMCADIKEEAQILGIIVLI